MRLIFKTSSVTPNFFYVFNIILSFSTYSRSFKKICTWELLGANVLNISYPTRAHGIIGDLQIGPRVRDWIRVRLFNSNFQASHYHDRDTHPFHPMSYSLYRKLSWRTRALETSLVRNLKIVLVLNLVLVVQSECPYLTIRLRARVFYEQIVNEAQSHIEQYDIKFLERSHHLKRFKTTWT